VKSSILQRFLDIGMLNIGEEDEKFKYLENASRDIAKSLSEKKLQLINYTLVALDPNIPPDEPVLLNVESAKNGTFVQNVLNRPD